MHGIIRKNKINMCEPGVLAVVCNSTTWFCVSCRDLWDMCVLLGPVRLVGTCGTCVSCWDLCVLLGPVLYEADEEAWNVSVVIQRKIRWLRWKKVSVVIMAVEW